MKKILSFCFILPVMALAIISEIKAQSVHPYDPVIQNIVDSINGDTLMNDILILQGMERYALSAGATQSSNFLKNHFNAFNFDTVYTQNVSGSYIPNIIAVKYGMIYPDSVIILGAHYDSYAAGAPAADDNGSGTAAVMEAARVITEHDYKRTIKLIFFAAEEQGIVGSTAYATNAYNNGEKIIGAFCPDAIGYVKPGDPVNSDVYLDSASVPLRNAYAIYTSMYIPGFTVANVQWPVGATSDVAAFWDQGYKSIMPSEGQYDWIPSNNHMSPFMHTSDDSVGTINQTQTLKITQSMVAATLAIAEIYSATSIEEYDSDNANTGICIYPNPSSGKIQVESSGIKVQSIEIYNVFGEKIFDRTFFNQQTSPEINISGSPKGIYLVKIYDGNNFYADKIAIN